MKDSSSKHIFNHSKKDVVLEREQADLISLGSISDDQLVIHQMDLLFIEKISRFEDCNC